MLEMLITVVITLLVVGVLVWAIRSMPVIDPNFKQMAIIVIIVCAVIWLLYRIVPFVRNLPNL